MMRPEFAIVGLVAALVGQASWKKDISNAPIPKQAASGLLNGKSFAPKVCKIKKLGFNTASDGGVVKDKAQAYILELASDHEFFPAQKVEIWFAVDPAKSLAGLKLSAKPYKFGTDEARMQTYGKRKGTLVARGVTSVFASYQVPGSKLPKTDMFSDEFSIRLEFASQVGTKVQGTVFVTLPDQKRSFLAGSFQATLQN